MSDRENQDDFKVAGTRRVPSAESSDETEAFEAALRSLRPRADALDRRWRFLLAQEAAFNNSLPENEVQAAGRSVCTRCGGTLSPGRSRQSRWAWPTAFSTMTVVAATLFVALLVRARPEAAIAPGAGGAVAPLAATVKDQADSIVGLAGDSGLLLRPIFSGGEASYLGLRDQVLRCGVDSWQLPVAAVVTTKIAKPPLSYREQFDRLLKEEGSHGS
jgi:hypothetical protein